MYNNCPKYHIYIKLSNQDDWTRWSPSSGYLTLQHACKNLRITPKQLRDIFQDDVKLEKVKYELRSHSEESFSDGELIEEKELNEREVRYYARQDPVYQNSEHLAI